MLSVESNSNITDRSTFSEASDSTATNSHNHVDTIDNVVYENVYRFRNEQLALGVDLSALTNEKWGKVALDKCHHISTTVSKDGPQSYRVRICKTCCQDSGHIELGTYVDQESAILVNDVYEIMRDRTDRLIVLRKEDKPYLHLLRATRFDRVRGRDSVNILDMLVERSLQQQQGQVGGEVGGSGTKKRKSLSSATLATSTPEGSHNSSSISPASSSTSPSPSPVKPIHQVLQRSPFSSASSSSTFSQDTTRDDFGSIAGSSPLRVTSDLNLEDSNSNNMVGADPSRSSPSEDHQPGLDIDTAIAATEAIGDVSVSNVDILAEAALTAERSVMDYLAPLVAVASSAVSSSPPSSPTLQPSDDLTTTNLLLLKNMPDANLSPAVQFKRQRSSTFSAPSFTRSSRSSGLGGGISSVSSGSLSAQKTPMAALTWLASMQDDEVDVAKSLFELSGAYAVPGAEDDVGEYRAHADEDVEYAHDGQFGEEALSPYHHYSLELMLPGEEESLFAGRRSDGPRRVVGNSRSVAVPNNTVVSRASGGVSGTGRARSYSMTYIEKTRTASTAGASSSSGQAVIASSAVQSRGGGRLSDPLAAALKRYSEKGGAQGGSATAGYIGIYSPEDRKARIQRFIEKRKLRMWTKKVKYDVRKNFADSRVRVKGRFVKKEDEAASPASAHNGSRTNAHDDGEGMDEV